MKKVLITADVHHILQNKLTEFGYKCDVRKGISYKEVTEIINEYEGLIIRSLKVDKTLIFKGEKLKFIGRAGSGLENVDIEFANKHNVQVFNSPEGNRTAVAEHTIGMLLSLLHRLKSGDNEVAQLIWDRNGNSGHELASQTVGIIGYGNMGRAFAQRLKGFGCRILVHDKYINGFNDHSGIEEVELPYLLANSTVISLHLPFTDETKGYVDEVFLNKTKKQPILINTSRGGMINLQLMINSIDKNQISGLALDVFPNEPLKSLSVADKTALKMLSERPNVLLTPHSGGLTRQSYVKLANVLAEKIIKFLKFNVSLLILCLF